MLSQLPQTHSDHPALSFLKQYPTISHHLCAEVGSDLSQLVTLIEPLLDAPRRCALGHYFIHAVAKGRTAFLSTNLPDGRETLVSEVSNHWFLGRNTLSAIVLPHPAVSRAHAMLGFCPARGFYVLDVGSKNGTCLNDQRLETSVQHWLKDGDQLSFSHFQVEFFTSGWQSNERPKLLHQDLASQDLKAEFQLNLPPQGYQTETADASAAQSH